jgi:tricorn protease
MMSKVLVRVGVCASIGLALLLGVRSGVRGEAAVAEPERPPAGPTRLLRYADISKDAVVFSYAGDLWTASRQGGAARRLTTGPGDKLYPKYSPDGKWIAFTASYDGNPDVYVIPSDGGEPRRLTYHPATDIVLGWTPDGKNVLFRSDRISAPPQRTTRLFLVSLQGGLPKVLPVPRGDLTSFSPDGNKIAYIETSQEFRPSFRRENMVECPGSTCSAR